MTGYGQGKAQLQWGTVTVELKSVNHRYGEVIVRMPRSMMPLEMKVRDMLKDGIHRGRLEMHCELELAAGLMEASLDKQLAISYHGALVELKNALHLSDTVKLSDIIGLPEVVRTSEAALEPEQVWVGLREATATALGGLLHMRQSEGKRLMQQLESSLDVIASMVATIEERSGDMVLRYRERLKKRMAQLMDDVAADEGRLAQELALMADRCCIAEEVVRLRSHLEQCQECLQHGGAAGRRLDFLCQEVHREINTIAAKSADVEISRLVVDLKSELEKMREQAQNIE